MTHNCDTLIHAGILITQNQEREIFRDYSLVVKNGTIQDMGPTNSIRQSWRPKEEMDYSGHILMPGLINAHTHATMTFLRGLGDDLPLMEWLNGHIFPLEKKLTPEIVRLGSMLGYAEMLSSGTTACVDMYIFEETVFAAAEEAGIRCMGGEAIFEFPSAAFGNWQDALDATAALAEKYAGHETIKVAVNPHSVYTTTPEILQACGSLAREMGLPLHVHLAETARETDICLQKYGMRPIAWCNHNKLFDAKVIAAHMVDVSDDEISFLRETDTVSVHNPASNMKLASGGAPVWKMLNRSLAVALGTDGAASNNSLNMFSEMKLAALLQKFSLNDPLALPAQKVLDMATRNGAMALDDPGLGSLAPGQKADCIALDASKPALFPAIHPVSQVVYSASGNECVMTMVNGEVVFRDGKFLKFDYDALLKELDNLRRFIIENR